MRITIIGLLLLISGCAARQPMVVSADLYVSDITQQHTECTKQHCQIAIAETEIAFLSDNHALLINSFSWVHFSDVMGIDQNKVPWEVMVGNMVKEPYIMLLKSDSLAILVGWECYNP